MYVDYSFHDELSDIEIMSEKWLYFRCYQSEYFQSASFNRFQMSDIVKFGENISIIQKRATFEKISILEVYYRWQASGGRKCGTARGIFRRFRSAERICRSCFLYCKSSSYNNRNRWYWLSDYDRGRLSGKCRWE